MKKIKSNIHASAVFIIVSSLVIIFMEIPCLQLFRTNVVSLSVFSILKGNGDTIANISIGILGSSIIAIVSSYIEYRYAREIFVDRVNQLCWRFYNHVLPELHTFNEEEIIRLFDVGGIMSEFFLLCSEYTRVRGMKDISKMTVKKLSVIDTGNLLCTQLLNNLRAQMFELKKMILMKH